MAAPAHAATYSGGSGTAGDPYLISTSADLLTLANTANSADWGQQFLMTQDIDMSAVTGFTPIGNYPYVPVFGTSFTGVFDGGGHAIQNLTINLPAQDYVGLFGYISLAPSQVRNLGMQGGAVTGGNGVGGLVGHNGGTVRNCFATDAVTGDNYVGGLLGENFGTVTGCYAAGEVTGDSDGVGGLVGQNQGPVTSCYAMGAVMGNGGTLGGLVGYNEDAPLTGCYATGTVRGNSSAGGLVGTTYSGTVRSCYATGAVTGTSGVGGLIGNNGGRTVIGCYATGAVTGNDRVGGLLGASDFNGGTMTGCYATGAVTGATNLGGLVGFLYAGTVTSSFWDTQTGGPDNGVGTGLPTAQMKQRATFESAGWDFSGTPPVWYISEGLSYPQLFGIPMPIDSIAALQALSIAGNGSFFLTRDLDASETADWGSKSTNPGFEPIGTAAQPFNGTLDGHGHRVFGLHVYRPAQDGVGLFGYLGSSGVVRGVGLEDVTITGRDQTGGMAGVSLGTVEQCYVRGAVAGANGVGALLGENGGAVTETYAAAALTGTSVGGLVGLDNGGNVSTSFWDTTLSGVLSSGGGIGLGTETMQSQSTYASAGWDLADTWAISDGLSYPYFKESALLSVVTGPPRLISADTVDVVVATFVPGLFVTVGGGAYPAYAKMIAAGQTSITVPLKQEAINKLIVSSLSETGEETVVARYSVYESAAFPSTPTPVTALTLTPASASLAANATQQFFCMATFADGTTGDVTAAANWNASSGTITAAGLYTHASGTVTIQALLYTEDGWHSSNIATVTTSAKSGTKSGTGQVGGVVRSLYTNLGLPTGRVTAYGIFNPIVVGQYAVHDTLGNFGFFMPEGKYHFEGAYAGYRSELVRGGYLIEGGEMIDPGPPPRYSEPYYSGQVKANRPLSYDFALRPNDTGAPWVVFIEPVADTIVNTDHIVVTAIDADQYSELAVAKYAHNAVEYAIPDRISSTGFYREAWPLELGINVLHLFTMDTAGNASQKTIQITYNPNYTGPGGDSDGDGMPDAWETAHGLNAQSAVGVNGAQVAPLRCPILRPGRSDPTRKPRPAARQKHEIVWSRFFYEATNDISSRFLREATGYPSNSRT